MIYILPIIFSGFTAWLISWLTIKLLFNPTNPIKVFRYKFQGIVPARRDQMISTLENKIATEFFSFSELQSKLSDPGILDRLKPAIEAHVDHFLEEKMSIVFPMIFKLIGEKTKLQFKQAFMDEIETLFPTLLHRYTSELEGKMDFGKMVSVKLSAFSNEKLRALFYSNFKSQIFRYHVIATLTGLVLGFLQVILLMSV